MAVFVSDALTSPTDLLAVTSAIRRDFSVQERHRCVLCFHALLVTEATLCAGSQCGCLCVDDVSSATNVTGALTKPLECTQMGAAGLDKLHGPRATWRCPCQFGCVYPTGAERRVLERKRNLGVSSRGTAKITIDKNDESFPFAGTWVVRLGAVQQPQLPQLPLRRRQRSSCSQSRPFESRLPERRVIELGLLG